MLVLILVRFLEGYCSKNVNIVLMITFTISLLSFNDLIMFSDVHKLFMWLIASSSKFILSFSWMPFNYMLHAGT